MSGSISRCAARRRVARKWYAMTPDASDEFLPKSNGHISWRTGSDALGRVSGRASVHPALLCEQLNALILPETGWRPLQIWIGLPAIRFVSIW